MPPGPPSNASVQLQPATKAQEGCLARPPKSSFSRLRTCSPARPQMPLCSCSRPPRLKKGALHGRQSHLLAGFERAAEPFKCLRAAASCHQGPCACLLLMVPPEAPQAVSIGPLKLLFFSRLRTCRPTSCFYWAAKFIF